ncbi:UDP glucuronosyltransferase 2 family, polypeptide A3 precursor [Silurus asotus]|uniref:glucuronosyltransferase n=1 Tax=Silurus asotus TaxID=30991 RepID=A0AAD5AG66_SILAS|nr:UDP glucuronosyltransferase 2 family, polypeptide A3 precursor [Silurus asotus]
MKTIIDELITRGHSVTIVTYSATPSIMNDLSSSYNVEIIQVPHSKKDVIENLDRFLNYWIYEMPNNNMIQSFLEFGKIINKMLEQNQALCRELFFAREDLLEKWRREKYDVLLTDPVTACGELLAEKLNLPFIHTLRLTFGYAMERLCGQLPAPPSYVPSAGLVYTDHMDFLQRVKNILYIAFQDVVFNVMAMMKWNHLFTEVMGSLVTISFYTMMRIRSCTCLVVLFLNLFGTSHSGNVLVLPGEYSHWHNIRTIVEELLDRNHSVTVLTHSASPTLQHGQNERFKFMSFKINMEQQEADDVWQKFISAWMQESTTIFKKVTLIRDMMSGMIHYMQVICNGMFSNSNLVNLLKEMHFDVLLYDPMMPCAGVMADVLELPSVMSLRVSFAHNMERFCGQMPAPPSYVPAAAAQGHLTDHMDFFGRLENMLLYIVHTAIIKLHRPLSFDKHFLKINGKPITLCENIGKADIWLIRTYWDFEYPRPFLPNFKFVGGLHCKPAKPLPKDMEDFVQSSGDDGVVVFSLGTMIKNLTTERVNTIASALGQIPQKVLWRYKGGKPETLAPNTRLYDWIPQNDLLGHPKTKAFITHGGTNGIYEAIYHGVPMVGIPLFADQPDNLNHMKTRGAAVMLDLNKMESKDLKQALDDIINNPSYKENIMRLSRIHHDQPIKPLDQAVFWIEFVMRNKGAKHLRVAAHDLTWYQYHCLDVIAFLLSVIALVVFIFVKTCKWLFRKCFRKTPAKKSKKE